MTKHARQKTLASRTMSRSRLRSLLVSGAVGLTVLVGVGTWFFLQKSAPVSFAGQSVGGPRLAVDKELIDFGPVKYEQRVTARFKLRNVGDQPLRLAVNPQVEAIEGC